MKDIQEGFWNCDIDEYHGRKDILSRSSLMKLKQSPKHFKQWLDGKIEEDRPSLFFGRALHTYLLEHEEFEKKYLIVDSYDLRTKIGKEQHGKDLEEATRGNKEIIKQSDFEKIKSMQESLLETPFGPDILYGIKEQSLLWEDPSTGIFCKARPDIIGEKSIIDIKTTSCANESSFIWDITKYGYHLQAAMIDEGFKRLRELSLVQYEPEGYIFVAMEKEPPYAVGVYILHGSLLETGKHQLKNLLEKYRLCKDKNNWPGYETKIIGAPQESFEEASDLLKKLLKESLKKQKEI